MMATYLANNSVRALAGAVTAMGYASAIDTTMWMEASWLTFFELFLYKNCEACIWTENKVP